MLGGRSHLVVAIGSPRTPGRSVFSRSRTAFHFTRPSSPTSPVGVDTTAGTW